MTVNVMQHQILLYIIFISAFFFILPFCFDQLLDICPVMKQANWIRNWRISAKQWIFKSILERFVGFFFKWSCWWNSVLWNTKIKIEKDDLMFSFKCWQFYFLIFQIVYDLFYRFTCCDPWISKSVGGLRICLKWPLILSWQQIQCWLGCVIGEYG